ncbi:MAG: response regulator transcription factor [Bacteroidia bacterium]
MKNVLVVEDDRNMADLLKIHLKDLDCEVKQAGTGEDGLQEALTQQYDLIILDIMLPEMDGIEVCNRIRAHDITTPILMLTAKSEEIDKVIGLECGADDYMTKPFSVREFIARVKAIFRRERMIKKEIQSNGQSILRLGELMIDKEKRKVAIDDERIELTPKEFDLLVLLASTPGKSYTREQILNLVWGYEFNGYEHTVNSHINRLRSKIEKNLGKPEYILTAWGIGYRFAEI